MLIFTIIFLIYLHFLFMAFSIYYHRGSAHGQLTFSKPLEHFFRFVIYLSAQGISPEWMRYMVAQHTVHHKVADTINDVNSPHYHKPLLWYLSKRLVPEIKSTSSDEENIKKYAMHIPKNTDWIQRNVYSKMPYLGVILMGIVYAIFCGWWAFVPGVLISIYSGNKMLPFFGDYIIHVFGYRNAHNKGSDKSTNIFPIGIFLSGEELHNNHHNYPGRLNLALKWYEFDLGYYYCLLFNKLGLLKINPKALKK